MKIKITPERYRQIRRKAAVVYYKHNIQSFPVMPLYILRQYSDKLTIQYYGEFADKHYDGDLTAMREDFGDVPGCTIYNEKRNKYMILINEKEGSSLIKGRAVWTLAHEFGHIIFNHHISSPGSLISGDGIPDDLYAYQEAEANYFACMLLAYPAVIKACNIDTIDKMMKHCRISREAAEYRLKSIGASQMVHSDFDEYVLKQFSSYIDMEGCTGCRVAFRSRDIEYCPICSCSVVRLAGAALNGNGIVYDSASIPYKYVTCKNFDGHAYCNICGERSMDYSERPKLGGFDMVPRFCAFCGSDLYGIHPYDRIENAMVTGYC